MCGTHTEYVLQNVQCLNCREDGSVFVALSERRKQTSDAVTIIWMWGSGIKNELKFSKTFLLGKHFYQDKCWMLASQSIVICYMLYFHWIWIVLYLVMYQTP